MVQAKEEGQPIKRAAEKGCWGVQCQGLLEGGSVFGKAMLEGFGVGVQGCEAQGGSHSLHQPRSTLQTYFSSMHVNNCFSILNKL